MMYKKVESIFSGVRDRNKFKTKQAKERDKSETSEKRPRHGTSNTTPPPSYSTVSSRNIMRLLL